MQRGPCALEQFNFLRRLDWRWHWAQLWLDKTPRGWTIDDEDLASAIKFRRTLAHCQPDQARRRHERRWPAQMAAQQLAAQNGPLLWETKARILAPRATTTSRTPAAWSPRSFAGSSRFFFALIIKLQTLPLMAPIPAHLMAVAERFVAAAAPPKTRPMIDPAVSSASVADLLKGGKTATAAKRASSFHAG